jgi:uncharacterized protein YkwD
MMFVCVILTNSIFCQANTVIASDIKLVYNGSTIDTEVIVKESRALVPVREVFEQAGATLMWNPVENKITVRYNRITAEMFIGGNNLNVQTLFGKEEYTFDTAPQLIDGRTYVPLVFAAECLDADLQWSAEDRTAYINSRELRAANPAVKPFELSAGDKTVRLNESTRPFDDTPEYKERQLSVYGYSWMSYGAGTGDFMQLGVSDGAVVAFFSNSKNVTIAGITPGMSAAQLNNALGETMPLEEVNIAESDEGVLTVYRSALEDYKVTAVLAQKSGHSAVRAGYRDNYYTPAAELQLFNIINCERINRGLTPLKPDEQLIAAAQAHSAYMARRHVLSHEGEMNMYDRLSHIDLGGYSMRSENIGRGASDGIEMYSQWVNHQMYLLNMFSPSYTHAGIGAAGGGGFKMYFTMDFIERPSIY